MKLSLTPFHSTVFEMADISIILTSLVTPVGLQHLIYSKHP